VDTVHYTSYITKYWRSKLLTRSVLPFTGSYVVRINFGPPEAERGCARSCHRAQSLLSPHAKNHSTYGFASPSGYSQLKNAGVKKLGHPFWSVLRLMEIHSHLASTLSVCLSCWYHRAPWQLGLIWTPGPLAFDEMQSSYAFSSAPTQVMSLS
jgi:hypothetical protein